ncbi:hypothetical protein NE237_029605 [Protea cynaroides]|uniref:Uncharacterized protein n=1 Tax=Protea cynaroides TaxID=273540 RepID=A0A9Q0JWE8_9MAGN|nr:hypothetical protein NE237_029605 [Protea cynaroides]
MSSAFLDDLWVADGQNDVLGDDLFIDDLLNLSNDDIEVGLSQGQEEEKPCVAVSSQGEQPCHDNSKPPAFPFPNSACRSPVRPGASAGLDPVFLSQKTSMAIPSTMKRLEPCFLQKYHGFSSTLQLWWFSPKQRGHGAVDSCTT